MFSDHKDKNQGRVDSVVNDGESLLKENPVAQKDEKEVRDTINNTQNSWNNILQRFDDVEQRFVDTASVYEGECEKKQSIVESVMFCSG